MVTLQSPVRVVRAIDSAEPWVVWAIADGGRYHVPDEQAVADTFGWAAVEVGNHQGLLAPLPIRPWSEFRAASGVPVATGWRTVAAAVVAVLLLYMAWRRFG